MSFYDPRERETKEIARGIDVRTFWGDKLMLAVVDLEANAVLPIHSHPHEQGGLVLKGELELTIDGETQSLKEGDVYLIPGGVEHHANAGAEPVQVLDIFTPIRQDLQY